MIVITSLSVTVQNWKSPNLRFQTGPRDGIAVYTTSSEAVMTGDARDYTAERSG